MTQHKRKPLKKRTELKTFGGSHRLNPCLEEIEEVEVIDTYYTFKGRKFCCSCNHVLSFSEKTKFKMSEARQKYWAKKKEEKKRLEELEEEKQITEQKKVNDLLLIL